jgi:hypothetical protein
MRTLTSLRHTCQDNDIEYRLVLSDSLGDGVYYPANQELEILNGVDNLIPKGFYVLFYNISFLYDQSGDFGVITASTFHNTLDYKYSDYLAAADPFYYTYNIDTTNSYRTTTSAGVQTIHWEGQKMINITHNTKDLKLRMKLSEFDGKVEPVEVTGTSTDVQETFSLVEWDHNFNWNDILLTNNVSVAGVEPKDVDQYLVQSSLFSFTVDAGKDGSVIDIDVHFQAYASVANVNDSIAIGPLTFSISATKINLFLKDASNNIIMETSDINPNDYIGVIKLKAVVDAGTYTVYASGATKTTLENYNNHGWTGLLVSRAGTGTVNSLNTLTQKSIADLRVPVFQTIDIDGSTTTAGTYLSELIPKGTTNSPTITINRNLSEAYLFRIF